RVLRKFWNLFEQISWNLQRETVIEQLRSFRIFRAPPVVRFLPAIVICEEYLFVLRKISIYILRHEVMFVRESERFSRRVDKFCACLAVGLVRACDFGNAFADERLRDDKLWFSIVATLRDVKRVDKLLHVLAFDFLDVKAVPLHAFAGLFALGLLCGGV